MSDERSGPSAAIEGYGVRLDEIDFEGPLDLLLYLIKKNEVDVTDIPIALVTEQFLVFLERITAENLEAAGDFLLMAATLMRIKARMLLPPPEAPEDEELEDPRRELVDRLLEYQRYKEVAGLLREREEAAARLFARGLSLPQELRGAAGTAAPTEEPPVTLVDLLRAFGRVLAARTAEPVHRVEAIRVTLEDRVRHVRRALAERERLAFGELFPLEAPRIELVVTFVALLEMVRNREVRLRQEENFDEIVVLAGELLLPEDAPAQPRDPSVWDGDPPGGDVDGEEDAWPES
ncbi:MAG: ScpA family protein [Gemmatimonadota bacterium]